MKRTHLPLNALRVFDAAARHLSFTRAADELAVTPAAVGQQIRALEDMNPINDPAMDKTYVQGATVPLGLAGMMQSAGVSPTPPDDAEDDEEEPEDTEEIEASARRLALATKKNGNGVHHG